MAGHRRRKRGSSGGRTGGGQGGGAGRGGRGYQRTDRLSELFREILAEELERSTDDRLELVTVMGVDVQRDIERATVYYSSIQGEESDPVIEEALADARPALQRAIGRQARVRRVPELVFRPDPAVREAERIEEILRDLQEVPPSDSLPSDSLPSETPPGDTPRKGEQ